MRLRRGAVLPCVAALATAVALVALVGACGEFGVAGGTNDRAPEPVDAATVGVDGAAGDADAPGDAGAAEAADASCGTHDFCADFEVAPAAGWAGDQTGGGGVLGIAFGTGMPGNALVSTIPATADLTAAFAYVSEPFAGAAGLHVELAINAPILGLPSTGDVTILEVSGVGVAGIVSGVGVVLRSTAPGLSFFVAHGDNNFDTPTAMLDLPRGNWAQVVVDFRFGASGSLKVLVNGSVAFDQKLVTVLPATPGLRVGLQHYNGATSAFAAQFDSVRVDILH